MAFTYSKLAETTVGVGGAATIAFNNIPQNYTDLVVKISTRNASSGIGTIRMGFNGSTVSNYNYRQIQGDGTNASSSAGTNAASTANEVGLNNGNTSTTSTFSNNEIYIPNYASSTNKSWSADSIEEENATTAYIRLTAGLWSNVTAITSITFTADAGSFAQYSTAYLYGIRIEL